MIVRLHFGQAISRLQFGERGGGTGIRGRDTEFGGTE